MSQPGGDDVFSILLSKEQCAYVSRLLPKGYSARLKRKKEDSGEHPIKMGSYPAMEPPTTSGKGHFFPKKQEQMVAGEYAEVYQIVRKLKKSPISLLFRTPVNAKLLKIPHYYEIVHEGMDLKTIEDNIRGEKYKHPAEVHRDIYKIMMNSYKFNEKKSSVFTATAEFEELYLEILNDISNGEKRNHKRRDKVGEVREPKDERRD